MRIVRTVTADVPLSAVFAFLSDFTTTMQWDPGTVRTDAESGRRRRRHDLPQRVELPRAGAELTYEVEAVDPTGSSRCAVRTRRSWPTTS